MDAMINLGFYLLVLAVDFDVFDILRFAEHCQFFFLKKDVTTIKLVYMCGASEI